MFFNQKVLGFRLPQRVLVFVINHVPEDTMSKQTTKTIDQQMLQIALDHLFIETLETRNSDRLDFHEVSVWGVRSALLAAYEAGRQAAQQD